MNDLSKRISFIIETLGIKKTAFAERLNVSQAFISQLCSGVKKPSDRTIYDICREFDVNEEWLRYGTGEVFAEKTMDQELTEFAADLMTDEEDSFRRRLIRALSKLSVEQWEVLEQIAKDLAKKK